MRIVALHDAAREARATAARFPFVLLAALAAAVAAQVAVDANDDDITRLIFSAGLGLPLMFALAVTAERRGWSQAARIGTAVVSGLLLVWLHVAARGWSNAVMTARYLQLAFAFHLLVAVLPYIGTGTLRGFWQYNRILFLRFLLATLYAAVLFGGLAIALVALDQLFGVDIDGDAYARLWILLAFIFHPWFFLAGVPRDLDALDTREDYPLGLKVFAQFVLVPLVTVYVTILTAYLVRVVVTTTWPSGWIGWLVSSVAAAGTLALLLVHPIRERDDARWVDAYARWFYVVLLPSIAMLLMAVGLRIGQYGITEQRYFLLALSIWLAAIAVYYGVTGSRNIRVIPISLCILALLSFAGPWSAYAVSRRSQANRLEAILERNGMRVDGALRPPAQAVSFEDRKEISATVRYLVQTHGEESLERVDPSLAAAAAGPTPVRPDTAPPNVDDPKAARAVAALGVEYVNPWQGTVSAGRPFHVWTDDSAPIDVAGYDVLARISLNDSARVPVRADTLRFTPTGVGVVRVSWRGEDVGVVRLDSLIAALPADSIGGRMQGQVPEERRTVDVESEAVRLRIILRQLGGTYPGEGQALELNVAQADVLVDVR
jgi:hypothetical protein